MIAVAETAPRSASTQADHSSTTASPLLEVTELRHAFGETPVLDGLSFAVGHGEIFALLGPNGCGKSTTLRVLLGLLIPDSGELRFSGERVGPGDRKLRQRMGVVFQSPSLDLRLTARENLTLAAQLHGVSTTQVTARIAELLEFTELGQRADEPVLNYSGGMRRRLELARALLHEPSLVVMDEPTTGLDERSFRRTWERIERMRRERGVTVLFTTHRAEEAQLCDRVAVVDCGHVVTQGTPDALRAQVSGDILTLEAEQPESLAEEIAERFSVPTRVLDGKVVIERERGHELIPRIVESLPVGRIASLSMHRPTLADVFVKITGRSLRDDLQRARAEGSGG